MNYSQETTERLISQCSEIFNNTGRIPQDVIIAFNNICQFLYNKEKLDEDQIHLLDLVLKQCNIIYENSDFTLVDDEFYDQLVEKYRQYRNDFRIGAENVSIVQKKRFPLIYSETTKQPLIYENIDRGEMLFYDELSYGGGITKEDLIRQTYDTSNIISKRKVDAAQLYPELVGTLDKCKFVLNQQAKDRGVFNDSNVKIFERDFLGKHLQQGLINNSMSYELVAELKYDGV